MKKNIMFFTCVMLCFISCRMQNNCEIRGTVGNQEMNGKYVYIMSLYPQKSKIVDSVKIEGSKFSWKGAADTSKIYRLCVPTIFQLAFDLQDVLVVKQSGVVNVSIEESSSSVGTPLNDSLQRWKEMKGFYDKQKLDIYNEHRQMGGYDSPDWENRIDSLNKDFARLNKQFIFDNKGNVVGRFIDLMMNNSPVSKKE